MWTVMPSPVGDLRIVERDGSIVAIEFSPFRPPADGRPLGPRSDDAPVLVEAVPRSGQRSRRWQLPGDEWQAIALNYTSGTTGDPKGVVIHHRGAYLNSFGNAVASVMGPDAVYLWTLPMFHCNGWSFTWTMALLGGTNVCLRRVETRAIFESIRQHRVQRGAQQRAGGAGQQRHRQHLRQEDDNDLRRPHAQAAQDGDVVHPRRQPRPRDLRHPDPADQQRQQPHQAEVSAHAIEAAPQRRLHLSVGADAEV